MSGATRARGVVATALLVTMLSACVTWERSTEGPRTVVPELRPSSVRLTLGSGAVATVESPIVRNDSIVAGRGGAPGVAAEDVVAVEIRRFSVVRTLLLVAAGAAAAAAWTAAAASSSGSEGDAPPIPKVTELPGIAWLGRVLAGGAGP